MFLKALKDDEKEAFLELAYHAARVDKFLTLEELALWRSFRAELNLPETTHSVKEQPLAEAAARFKSDESRRAALLELVMMIMADGVQAPVESRFLNELLLLFSLAPSDLSQAIDWVQRQMALTHEGQAMIAGKPILSKV